MASPGKSVLVLGGARSGKSSYAEKMVESSGLQPLYLATGRAFDKEMENRIAIHRDRRGSEWQTVEEPLDLVGALTLNAAADRFVLVDCLTLWLTNLMMAERDIATETASLVAMLPDLAGPVVFVSNEVGLGIVPENRMAREFRDHAGFLHQAVAAIADEVYFMAAGLPLRMKG
ncbi:MULTISPECIES: bifunctional adenosylcobinamide kinase/adenosylcobinamide-phosphate guanylyltransferase [Brucella/Ochrobactrum group]|uniref:Bifunctional adenosylcobalamin biosynthesis protein n=1 Tax=Brucella anthropi (strain ATCC 49188 / DSM 6882 / CCUG 24695 / JCM 21032 / LMG 3331 / NBRC 15819 / NCTC 12168 / Alc 37) TaxID=439375 RepID=A6X037_BRUA4|nr:MULTISPECIES: bifunctional adenosylcobinamide kinase/adenosylcobinamide-phosphate guanylyltransferase [Brucella/Ochrobactrum group]ABS14591.1 Adenosylcobinamide-phosphate guanylyltransferase [Brucella anthropi ATCC 49188]AIK43680.1 bifunctional adenosylcobalamin biosynthesis protein CobP [Brucella anthropi]KAB2739464.1 bifunctional adenosylcobinamide kinase/adenosylcobinamide-phosphate guanylyltransferase [Brucella anthropi]KAB2752589.1 bifunctional adenosylcobinamide kinase/adenosylcobinami